MKKQLILTVLCTLFCGALTHVHAALSHDPSLQWRTLTTKHFEVHFHDGEQTLANEVGAISEQVHKRLSKKYNWTPAQRTQVILTDRFDFANGSATPMPRNEMRLLVTPPLGSSVISDHDNWLELLIVHEYTHVLHLDKASGPPSTLRKILGRNLFTFPNLMQPPYFIEGLATYEETDSKRGIGRGQGTLFRGMMRQEVSNGIKPVHQTNQPLVSWPMNTTRYLYGVYFYQFIADRYGTGKITELVEQYSNNLLPLAINSNSKKVLGKDMVELWAEFSQHLRETFAEEIKNIQQAGEVTGQAITSSGYLTRSPQALNNGDIYYLENDMQNEPQLMLIKQGETTPQAITDVRGSSFDLHASAGIIGTEINLVNNTNYFSDIYYIDLKSGKKTQLTQGQRYLHATWSPSGENIIAVHNQLGQHALHLLDDSGKKIDTLWQGNNNTIISSVDWSPDGKNLVMAVWRPDTLWNLERFEIESQQWSQLTHGTDIENAPMFNHDGTSIVFSADYDGVFNIYQLTLADNQLSKLSNVIGEARTPFLLNTQSGEQLLYTNLTGNGYDLFRLDNVTPLSVSVNNKGSTGNTHISKAVNNLSSQHVSLDEINIEPYNALTRIAPTAWFPYFLTDDVRSEIGITTSGADPLRRHRYNALLAYDTDNKWPVGRINYIYDRWDPTLKFSIGREVLAYADNNGNLERYRNADTVSAEALWPFLRYERQWLLHAGIHTESESDEKLLSMLGPANTFNDRIAGLAISFNSARKYARSVSASNGRQLRIVAEDNELLDSDYSGQVYTLDWHELVDLPGQHVLSARAALGWGTDTPRPFKLGGTLDTRISPTPAVAAQVLTERIFGQRRYPLHGYDEGRADLRGRRMALIEAEWRFPIALFERGLMTPPIGIHQLHGKLIYNWGESWSLSSDIPALRRGAGIELTAELVIGYWLPMNVRVGYARGFDLGGEEQTYLEARIPLF